MTTKPTAIERVKLAFLGFVWRAADRLSVKFAALSEKARNKCLSSNQIGVSEEGAKVFHYSGDNLDQPLIGMSGPNCVGDNNCDDSLSLHNGWIKVTGQHTEVASEPQPSVLGFDKVTIERIRADKLV